MMLAFLAGMDKRPAFRFILRQGGAVDIDHLRRDARCAAAAGLQRLDRGGAGGGRRNRCRDQRHHRRGDAAVGRSVFIPVSVDGQGVGSAPGPSQRRAICAVRSAACRATNRARMRCWNSRWPAAGTRTGTCSMATRSASVRSARRRSRSSSRIFRPICCYRRTISAGCGSRRRRCWRRSAVTPASLIAAGEYDLLLRCVEQAGGVHHVPKLLCQRMASGTGLIRRWNRRRWSGCWVGGASPRRSCPRRLPAPGGSSARCRRRARSRSSSRPVPRTVTSKPASTRCGPGRPIRTSRSSASTTFANSELAWKVWLQRECRQDHRYAWGLQLVDLQQPRSRGRGRRVSAVPE